MRIQEDSFECSFPSPAHISCRDDLHTTAASQGWHETSCHPSSLSLEHGHGRHRAFNYDDLGRKATVKRRGNRRKLPRRMHAVLPPPGAFPHRPRLFPAPWESQKASRQNTSSTLRQARARAQLDNCICTSSAGRAEAVLSRRPRLSGWIFGSDAWRLFCSAAPDMQRPAFFL